MVHVPTSSALRRTVLDAAANIRPTASRSRDGVCRALGCLRERFPALRNGAAAHSLWRDRGARLPDRCVWSQAALAALLLLLPVGGCTNFVFTGTSTETVEVVREAMRRIQATEESITRRPDLSPEELEMTFLVRVPKAATSARMAGPAVAGPEAATPPTPPPPSSVSVQSAETAQPPMDPAVEPVQSGPVVGAQAEPTADAPHDLRTIFVRIVPWGDVTVRQRTITLDAWRWNGVPPMWGGSAQSVQVSADQALNAVLAERSR